MIGAILRLLRPGDWVKNIFVFPALIFALPTLAAERPGTLEFSHVFLLVTETLMAFLAFCVLSSGFYAINDVVDAEDDRKHPVKKFRPVASNAISPNVAILIGGSLVAVSFAIGFIVSAGLGVVLMLYATLQVAYNFKLRHIVLVDVVCIATGFALRATAGAVAIEVQLSVWLILCVFFLCVFLGFIKRFCDLTSAQTHGANEWQSPAGYKSRDELNWLLGVSSVLAIMMYLMYTLSDHAASIFGGRTIGFAFLTPLVIIAVHRFYRRAEKGTSDSPFDVLTTDRAILASVVLFITGVFVTLYVPGIGEMLEEIFIVQSMSVE